MTKNPPAFSCRRAAAKDLSELHKLLLDALAQAYGGGLFFASSQAFDKTLSFKKLQADCARGEVFILEERGEIRASLSLEGNRIYRFFALGAPIGEALDLLFEKAEEALVAKGCEECEAEVLLPAPELFRRRAYLLSRDVTRRFQGEVVMRREIWRKTLSPRELWDAYDKDLHKIECMTLARGEIPEGVYHLTVHVLVRREDGKYLLMKRAKGKRFAGMWEATAGGNALKGESALKAARRALREKTGLIVRSLTELGRERSEEKRTICVQYLCAVSGKRAVKLRRGATCAFKWTAHANVLRSKNPLLSRLRPYILKKKRKSGSS